MIDGRERIKTSTEWEMIKKDNLIERLKEEQLNILNLENEVTAKMLETEDSHKRQELNNELIIHVAHFDALDAVMKIINAQPSVVLINAD